MKVVSFVAIKGGVGKTTLTYNFGEWLASKGYTTLLIDADSQCSLSQTYNIYTNKNTIADIFNVKNNKSVKAEDLIRHESPNLDIIPSTLSFDKVEAEIQTKFNKEMLMYMWMARNYNYLKRYKYVLIDCHPDFSIITTNMIIVSDMIYSPLEPGEYSYDSKSLLIERLKRLKHDIIKPMPDKKGNDQTYVNTKLMFVGNRIRYNTKSSHDFISKIKTSPDIIGFVYEKELLNQSTLFEKPLPVLLKDKHKYNRNKDFLDNLQKLFMKMQKNIK